jgi:hypothetical protein
MLSPFGSPLPATFKLKNSARYFLNALAYQLLHIKTVKYRRPLRSTSHTRHSA